MSVNNNKLIDTMRLFSLKNVIEKPTRVTNHSKTLLDHIIVSDTINYVFSDVFKLPASVVILLIIFVGIHSCAIFRKHFVNV
jgi:hypothetical protein